jgi:DNA polymerase-3 subunit delta
MNELTIHTFEKHIKKIKNDNLILLHGDEHYFFDIFLHQIEKNIFRDKAEKDLNYHLYSGFENSLAEVLAACFSFPMLADKKMVVIKDFDKLKIEDKESFLNYIKKPQTSTLLVLVAEKFGKSKFHMDIMKHATTVKCKSLTQGEIYGWTTKKFQEANINANRESITFLIENIGHNILRINTEIEKIINFLGPENSLTLDTVSQLTGFTREVNIFNFQKALASRDLKTSVKIGLQLIDQGDVLAAILPMLFIFFRRLWVVKQLKSKNLTQNQILQKLSGSKYAYSDIFASIDNFSYQHLIMIIEKLEESEIYLKTSQKTSDSILILLCYFICQDQKNN